ncbi:MAG: hypothetical protein CL583_05110 [Alteromonadaceae bacterium]|nr:hypothetical protein [Alteromonadaceae bacterium]
MGADNDEYAIQGSNFTNADHGTIIKDTGDAVTLLQNGQISSLPPEKLWDKHGSPWAKGLERTQSESNGRAHYQAKGKSYNGYLKPLENSGNTKLFVSWRLKLSESPGHAKGSNKFIRVWDKRDGKGTRISWTQMHMIYNGMDKASWSGWPGKAQSWNQMSLWVDADQGTIQARVNESLSHDVENFTKFDTKKGLNIKLLGFDPNYSEPYENIQIEIDDLYVSSSLARVIVSDKANWSEAQSRQSIQIPLLWSNDQIRFTYQPAEYLKLKRYVYVVNKRGEVNSKGFPINGSKDIKR